MPLVQCEFAAWFLIIIIQYEQVPRIQETTDIGYFPEWDLGMKQKEHWLSSVLFRHVCGHLFSGWKPYLAYLFYLSSMNKLKAKN